MLLTQAAHRHQQPQTITWLTGEGMTEILSTAYTHTTKRSLQHPQFPRSTRTSEWKSNASGSCDQSLQEQKAEPPEISRCSEATESCIRCLPKKETLSQRARRMLWNESMSDLKGIKQCSPLGKTTKWSDLGVNRPSPRKQLDIHTLYSHFHLQ